MTNNELDYNMGNLENVRHTRQVLLELSRRIPLKRIIRSSCSYFLSFVGIVLIKIVQWLWLTEAALKIRYNFVLSCVVVFVSFFASFSTFRLPCFVR